ncbi:single-stranded DNA-binding protein [uncultured Intestinimonas sp.]|uniref:single-stranded DNA-binding protein n=1 Tax=uncultured Intestinimonas sp. TaxID=1689265 RepID=UPI0026015C09|nr:single-stranded DNA-binding protein [uncultured Intestinimonas sp.]
MRTSWNENHAVLRGTAAAEPVFSHTNHGVDFFVFPLSVPRLSGTEDRLNVVVPQPLLDEHPPTPGRRLEVTGEVRTFNNRTGPGSRLVITLLARALTDTEEPPCNQLALSGVLCKPPVLRRTPLGREICDLMLAVNRRYGRADYLPCIAWGALAQRCGGLSVGDCVELEGRLQSRLYQKVVGGVTQERTAFEVSVTTLTPTAPAAASG